MLPCMSRSTRVLQLDRRTEELGYLRRAQAVGFAEDMLDCLFAAARRDRGHDGE